MLCGLGESETGIDDQLARVDPGAHRGVHPGQEFVAHLDDDVAVVGHLVRPVAPTDRQCISTHGTPASATTLTMSGSALPPDTSLTICAPFSRAARATPACIVSMLTVIPCWTSSLTTGSTLRHLDPRVDPGGAGAGRFAPDVDDGGTLGGQRDTVLDSAFAVEEQATVGERVICDVDDPHHLRSAGVGAVGWSGFTSQDQFQSLGPRGVVVLELAAHRRRRRRRAGLANTAHGHAQVFGLDHHDGAARSQLAHQRIGDLRGQPFLYLWPLGVEIHQPGDLRQPGDPAVDPGM